MKFIVFTIVIFFGIAYSASTEINNEVDVFETLSEKNKVRLQLKGMLGRLICSDIGYCCPNELTAQQIEFATAKVTELGKCLNTTVDRFIDIADDDIVRTDFHNIDNIRKYIGPVCDVFDNAFACILDVIPALDMCLSDREMIYKNKILSILPLVQSTLCLNNGALIVDILEHEDGPRCLFIMAQWIGKSGASELLFRDTTELFGSESNCREFNTLRQETQAQLGECSPNVLNLITEMSRQFCEGTKCKRFIRDLQCM